jgi:glycosyltransferase involved in cell wall biosynthesis
MENYSSKKIAVIDPSSYSLPYDYFYINELKNTFHVDFYFSKSACNYEYVENLKLCDNVTLHEYSISPSCTNPLFGLINYVKMLKDIFLKRKNYKKIHFIWSIFFLFESLFFLLIKDKLIFTFHNDVPHSYKRKIFWPFKIIMKLASKIVFVSNYTMSTFIKNYGVHPNYQLVQHGIMPIETLKNNKFDENINVEKTLLFWGRIEDYKGVDIFANFIIDFPVEIYGKWSPQLISLKNKLSRMKGIYINDSYLPFDELSTMLSREVVFILPYKDATQSGVLYTLLAYGKVFISSDVGENSDFLIKHGLGQLVFDRKEKESMKNAINYAFNEYNEIKFKLLQIKEEYEWDKIMNSKKLYKLYGS